MTANFKSRGILVAEWIQTSESEQTNDDFDEYLQRIRERARSETIIYGYTTVKYELARYNVESFAHDCSFFRSIFLI